MTRVLVSLREASRQLGIRLSTLQHHIKRGHVTLIDGRVDVEVARIQLERHTDHAQSRRARTHLAGVPSVPVEQPPASVDDDERTNWIERRTRAEALRAELELRARAGELVVAVEVDRRLDAFLADLGTRLDTIADRIAAEWGGDANLRRRIQEEVRRVRSESIDAASDDARAAA